MAPISDSVAIVWEGQVFGTGQVEVRCGIRAISSDDPVTKDPRNLDGDSEANLNMHMLWWVVLRK